MKLLLTLIFILSHSICFSSDLSYTAQINFEKTFIDSCIEKQKKNELNKNFEDWQIGLYCDCSARRVSEKITKKELAYVIKNKNFPESLFNKMNNAGSSCIMELMKDWGY